MHCGRRRGIAHDASLCSAALSANILSMPKKGGGTSSLLVAAAVLGQLAACGGPVARSSNTHTASSIAPFAVPRLGTTTTQVTSAAGLVLDQRIEPALPMPIEESAAGVAGGHLVVAGGLDGTGHDRADVWVLSGATWSSGPPLPQPVDHPAAATIGGTMYVAGGFSFGAPRAGVVAWNGDGTWVSVPPLPQPRGALALLSSGHMLIAAGGRGRGGEVAAVEGWTPGDSSWHELGMLPQPRDHLAGFMRGGVACFAGGRTPTTARVDCVDPVSRVWTQVPALPDATSGAGAGTLDGVPVVGGGEMASERGAMTSELWWLTGRSWGSVPMLLPRHGWEGAVAGGRLWACGGGVAPGLHPTATCTSVGPS